MKNNLKDVTFIIPVRIDSQHRKENLETVVARLLSQFETNVLVVFDREEDAKSMYHLMDLGPALTVSFLCVPRFCMGATFHRTAIINAGILHATTRFISIYDADVIFEEQNIVHAVEFLRAGADMVYPYSGEFVDISREFITTGQIIERQSCATESVGGAVFIHLSTYRDCGLENIRLVSHCPDDIERFTRMKKLGHRVERIPGKCYHIEHDRNLNSQANNPYTPANLYEFNRVKNMDAAELRNYVATWHPLPLKWL